MPLNCEIQIFSNLSGKAIRQEPNLHPSYIYLATVQLNFLNSYLDNPESECAIKSWITSFHKPYV